MVEAFSRAEGTVKEEKLGRIHKEHEALAFLKRKNIEIFGIPSKRKTKQNLNTWIDNNSGVVANKSTVT